jgi:RHS repeat-associated protein
MSSHMGVPIRYSDASGNTLPMPTSYSVPGFPGQSRTPGLAAADLYYNMHRDYDSSTGRYIQADPIGLDGGPSPYSYAMNNPLRYMDPSGLMVPYSMRNPLETIWNHIFPPSPSSSPRFSNPSGGSSQTSNQTDCPETTPPPPTSPYDPSKDYCGSGRNNVPDGNWGRACYKHDNCYGARGNNKEMCDLKLGADMQYECTILAGNPTFCAGIGSTYAIGLIGVGIKVDGNICGAGGCGHVRFRGPSRKAYEDGQQNSR